MVNTFTNITLSQGGTSVTIYTEVDEEVLNKTLKPITPLSSSGNWVSKGGSGKKETKIVDLLRIEERLIIDGYIIEETATEAQTAKSNLKTLFKSGGVMSMTYEGNTFNVNLEKISISRSATTYSDGGDLSDGEVVYKVKFNAIRGEDL